MAICDNCGIEVDKDDLEDTSLGNLCPDCYDETYMCDDCCELFFFDDLISTDDGMFCDDCYNKRTSTHKSLNSTAKSETGVRERLSFDGIELSHTDVSYDDGEETHYWEGMYDGHKVIAYHCEYSGFNGILFDDLRNIQEEDDNGHGIDFLEYMWDSLKHQYDIYRGKMEVWWRRSSYGYDTTIYLGGLINVDCYVNWDRTAHIRGCICENHLDLSKECGSVDEGKEWCENTVREQYSQLHKSHTECVRARNMRKSFNSMVKAQRDKTIVKSDDREFFGNHDFIWLSGNRYDEVGVVADIILDFLHSKGGSATNYDISDALWGRNRADGRDLRQYTHDALEYLMDVGMLYEAEADITYKVI